MAKRPRVRVRCVADKYASTGERIIEFFSDALQCGGLISFRENQHGFLVVEPYCCDEQVLVRFDRSHPSIRERCHRFGERPLKERRADNADHRNL